MVNKQFRDTWGFNKTIRLDNFCHKLKTEGQNELIDRCMEDPTSGFI